MSLPIAAVPFHMVLVMILWVLTCLALVFIILIQKGKGGGLSAAFGGAGGAGSLFGAKTGDALTWITIAIAGFFLLLSVVMGLYYRPVTTVTEQPQQTQQQQQQMPQGGQPLDNAGQAPVQSAPAPAQQQAPAPVPAPQPEGQAVPAAPGK